MITIPAVNGKHTKKSPRYYITVRCRSLFSLLYWRLRGAEIRQVNGVFSADLINFHLHSICMSKLANRGTKPALTDDVTKKYRMNICNEQRWRWQMPAIETASTKQKEIWTSRDSKIYQYILQRRTKNWWWHQPLQCRMFDATKISIQFARCKWVYTWLLSVF